MAAAHMRRAIELARRGLGRVSPNPPVGCVIVKDGLVVGEGWHRAYGLPHAEIEALRQAGGRAAGADVYVTLAPCCHHGKTPPCADALARAGVRRVFAAIDDPNPQAAGGCRLLSDAGIPIEIGLLANEAAYLARGFLKALATGLPFVTLKYALTLDGKIATAAGDARWISSPEARAEVHCCRAESDAVLTGIGTVLRDDPQLNARIEAEADIPQPRRVVADSRLRTPREAKLLHSDGGAVTLLAAQEDDGTFRELGAEVIACPGDGGRVDLRAGLIALATQGVRTVWCEGGAELAAALIGAGLVDEVVAYVAPKIVGGRGAPGAVGGDGALEMADAAPLREGTWEPVGPDIRFRGRLGDWPWFAAAMEPV